MCGRQVQRIGYPNSKLRLQSPVLTALSFGLQVRIDALDFAEVATTDEGQITLLGRCGLA